MTSRVATSMLLALLIAGAAPAAAQTSSSQIERQRPGSRLHADDLFIYERAVESAALYGLHLDAPPPPIDIFYSEGQRLPFGDFEARPHHTPGHCPGGVCLEVARPGERGLDLFVGDTLFAGTIGRTDLPGGDYQTLIASIRHVLLPFGDDARVYPGHGPDTTIGRERRTNPYLTIAD